MILGFRQYFPWHTEKNPAPTYFREKILASVGLVTASAILSVDVRKKVFQTDELSAPIYQPKLHTIREGSRWKAGDIMHMAYGVRTKNYQQFNKGISQLERVKSVQKIEIIRDPHFGCLIQIDNRQIGMATIQDLITNDGFDSSDDFLKWFNKDFVGQLIHFTDLKY